MLLANSNGHTKRERYYVTLLSKERPYTLVHGEKEDRKSRELDCPLLLLFLLSQDFIRGACYSADES